MILYTMMPQELIFPQETLESSNQLIFDHQGVPVLVEKEQDGYRVIRVMSTDPAHYLLDNCLPGTKITF